MISNVISAWSATWSVHDQSRDHCMISHVISACSVTGSVQDQPRDQCMIAKWSLATVTWSIHVQSRDLCMIGIRSSFLSVVLVGSLNSRQLGLPLWAGWIVLPFHLKDLCYEDNFSIDLDTVNASSHYIWAIYFPPWSCSVIPSILFKTENSQ